MTQKISPLIGVLKDKSHLTETEELPIESNVLETGVLGQATSS